MSDEYPSIHEMSDYPKKKKKETAMKKFK